MALTIMVVAPIMGIGGVIMALYEDVSLSLVLVVVVPLMAVVIIVMLTQAVPLFQSMQVKVDVREQALEALWDRIGLVPQRAYLFGGTVADNLRFGREDATNSDLWHALEVAQARDFVETMPSGLDAVIDQGGTNVSGGQRQRLAIARAVVKRPAVYLFDDCFSALDAGTDNRLRAALRAETTRSTVVIVAQRVSTIMHAERIIVLEQGGVVGMGTHDELVAGCAQYREIVASQLGEEAAA